MINIQELTRQVQQFHEAKEFEKAIDGATILIEHELEEETETRLGNVYVFALQVRCHASLELERYTDALEDAEIIVHMMPYETIGYFYRSRAYFNLDMIEAAKDDYKHLLSFSLPLDQRSGVYHSLALAEYVAGDLETSIQSYIKAAQVAPIKHPFHYLNMGIIHFRLGDMPAAWNAYNTALKIDPTDAHTLVGLAVLHADEDEWDEALKIWRKLLEDQPHFADPDAVARRYYRWTPSMADLARQIIARL